MRDRLKLVVFDLDGTLLDSIQTIVEGIRTCWDALGFPEVEAEQVRDIIGLPWEQGVELLMPGAGEKEVSLIRSYYSQLARGRPSPPPLFDGAQDVLDSLANSDCLLAIVTSRSRNRLDELMARNGLDGRFASVMTTDDGPGKPDPFLVVRAMDEAGTIPVDTVMIGDSTYDMGAGSAAGAGTIGVSWGVHRPEQLRSAGALKIATRFDQLHQMVDDILDGRQ